jgi:hypothetical protein
MAMQYPLNEQFLRDIHESLMVNLPEKDRESFEKFIDSEGSLNRKQAYATAEAMIKKGWIKTGHAI